MGDSLAGYTISIAQCWRTPCRDVHVYPEHRRPFGYRWTNDREVSRLKAVLFDLFGTLVDNATVAQVDNLLAEMANVLRVPTADFAKGWKATFQERSRGLHGSMAGSIVAAAKHAGFDCDNDCITNAVEI